ncbi:MAG: hypothetical protein HZA51_10445 [Planctomycetes bacterium]|nr:hypothetical protein [Planctomycetota bacterium]
MSPVRLAFIGSAKEVSPWLFHAVSRVACLEAVCGPYAESDSATHRARWSFSDLPAMLRETEPDGVIIAGPVSRRASVVKECLAARTAVLVLGNPGAPRELTRIRSLAHLVTRPVLIATPAHHSPAMQLARRLIDSEKIARPISMQLVSTWRRSVNAAGDSAIIHPDQVFEGVDLVRLLLGPLTRIHGIMHGDGVMLSVGVTDEHVPVSLAFHSGGPVESLGLDIEIRAADGACLRISRDGRLYCGNGTRVDAAHAPSLVASDPVIELGYDAMVKSFVHYITTSATGLLGHADESTIAADALLRPGRPRSLRRIHRQSNAADGRTASASFS